jgi:hypothetical protein
MKSERGFITLMFLSLLPLFISAAFAAYFCFSFLKSDMAVLNVCRAEQLSVQDKVGKDLEKLLRLNPKALKLRADEAIAQYKLEMATASLNPYAIAGAEAKLLWVQSQRQTLALRQKSFIQSANMKFTMAAPQISAALRQEWQRHQSAMTPWLQTSFTLTRLKTPLLAVQPDFPDAAPAYELVPRFEEAQSWVHSWQVQIRTAGWVRNFLKFEGSFPRSCATSLYIKNLEWAGKLKQVKSW